MANFGQYETVREVHRGGMGAVATARRMGGGAEEFIIKELRASAEILGEGQAARAIALFIARAMMQQRAAASPEAHWAPVHEAGESAGGAFYVTTNYPRSAQRLIHGRVKLDGRSLHTIADSVLAGLRELHALCGCAHGNLKPTNVLIAGDGETLLARVVLTDPADAESAASVAGDLRALGELIYGLVMHQVFRVRGGWPVPLSPEWSRLGPGGKAWLDLCNRLLDPALQDNPPSLDEIAAALPAPTVQTRSRRPLVIGAAAAGLVVLGGGALFLLSRGGGRHQDIPIVPSAEFNEVAWKDLCESYYTWFGPLDEYLNSPRDSGARRARFRQDPALAAILQPLWLPDRSGLDPRQIAGGRDPDLTSLAVNIPAEAKGAAAAGRTRAALAAIAKIGDTLTADQGAAWPLRARADKVIMASRERGWTGPSEHLRSVTARLQRSVDLGSAIDALLAESQLITDLEALTAAADPIAAAGDQMLATFPAMVAEATSNQGSQGREEAVRRLRRAVADLAGLSAGWTEFLGGDWTRTVDRDLFKAESSIHRGFAPGKTPSVEDFSMWFAEAKSPRFRALEEPNPFGGATLVTALGRVRESVEQLRSRPDGAAEADTYLQQLGNAEADRAAGAKRVWNRSTQDDVVSDYEAVAARVKRLGDDVVATVRNLEARAGQTLEAARTALAQDNEPTGSPEIDTVWRSKRDQIAQEPTAKAVTDRADEVRRFLRESVVAGVPAPPEFAIRREWVAGLTGAARAERERTLGQVAATIPWDGSRPPAAFEPDAGLLRGYRSWCESAVALAVDMAEVEDRLDGLYAIEQPAEGRKSANELLSRWLSDPVFTSPSAQSALKPVLDRVNGVRAVSASKDRGVLLAAAADTAHPERAFAAWRRLGDPDVPWPAVSQTLEEENRLQKLLIGVAGAAAAGSADPEPRRRALRDELTTGASRRWARHIQTAATPDEIRAASNLKTPLKGDESLVDDRTRFNLLLIDLEAAAKDPKQPDDQVREKIGAFVRSAGSLRGVTGVAAAAALLEALSPLTSVAPEAPKVDLTKIGPGDPRLGPGAWQAQAAPDNSLIRFTRQFPQGPQTLTFIRVAPKDAEPAFVCAHEATVGLFLSAIAAARQWDQVGGLLPDYNPQFGDNRSGPRVWQWNGAKAPGRTLSRATDWFGDSTQMKPRGANDAYPSAPPDLPPPPPAPDSPMNYVPPGAALFMARVVGCRLPTTAEMLAAISAELNDQTADVYIAATTANLRDETWNTQRTYIDGLVQAGRLSGINAPQRVASAGTFPWQPRDALSFREGYNDHAVWPVPASQGGGAAFKNLIGNVAEWVFDDAKGAEQIAPGAPPADLVASLVARGASGLRAVGGSAQSPRQADVLVPAPAPANPVGYSDVGFRLAFGAAGAVVLPDPLAVRLARVLATPRYLLP